MIYDSLLNASAREDAMCISFDWNADQTIANVTVWDVFESVLAQGELSVVNADMLADRTACNIKMHQLADGTIL